MAEKRYHRSDRAEEAPTDQVHARQLLCFPELVDELGGDFDALAERVGLSPAAVRNAGTAAYGEIAALLETAAAELACPDLGMRLALRQGATRMFGPAGKAMAKAPTFGEAMEFAASHSYAHSMAAVIWTRRFPESSQYAVGQTLLADGPLIRTQAIEQIFVLGHLLACELTGGHARPRLVMFRHQPVSPIQVYRRYFGCEVLFGQTVDVLVYHARHLELPLVGSDPDAYRQALAEIEALCPKHDPFLCARARVLINHFLNTEFCTRAFIASRLKLHPRTMDRRLNEHETSFLALRAEVRRELLRYYVEETGFDFASISERLGFSEQSVMSRSCRKWFRQTPRQLRATAAGNSARSSRAMASHGPPDLVFGPMSR